MVRQILIFMFVATLSGFFVSPVFAYEIGTHAFLTEEIVGFYNQNFPDKKIPEDLSNYLIDGSRREDNVPRYFNHFYDPVNDRGLANGTYRGQKSKDWAQDSKSQNKLVYKIVPATVASILTAAQLDKIQPVFKKADFTWQRAIDLYARGETEQALFALGHILHLIEDASVPDHTRNDAHPPFDDGGSPYENWTKRFSLENSDRDLVNRLQSKKPILLSDLNSYFNEMAEYSNNNFYSRDSMGEYKLPTPIRFNLSGRYLYGFTNDGEGEYKLVSKSGSFLELIKFNKENFDVHEFTIDNPIVLQNYWSRLSTKSVQYGAGVLNLFFQKAEKAKAKYELEKAQRPFLARLIDGFGGVFGGESSSINDVIESAKRGGGDFELVAEIPLDTKSNLGTSDVSPYEGSPEGRQNIDTNLRTPDVQEIHPPEINEEEPVEPEESAAPTEAVPQVTNPVTPPAPSIQTPPTQAPAIQVCAFNTAQTPTRQGAILNEVAWMGTHNSANDEWVELKNISGGNIDLNGWQLIDMAEQIKIIFGQEDKRGVINKDMLAGGYYLLERTDDTSVPFVVADYVYVGGLRDTDEGLRLFDKNCNLIDEVFANPDWPAGESNTRRSMERLSDLSWHTYLGSGENGILGTPRKENSLPPSSYNYGGSGGSSQNSGAQNNQATQESASSPAKILITEIQITGGTGKSDNDFIEIYNPNNSAVNLKDYRLVKRTQNGTTDTSIKSWTEDVSIQPKSFYLWANSNYTDIAVSPDVTTSATIAPDNGVAIRFGEANQGAIIDSVGFGEAQNSFIEGQVFPANPPANQSIQRKVQNNEFSDTNNNANDFETQTCPSPKARSGSCPSAHSNQAPSAFFDYAHKDPKVGDLITFDAASSTDPDGSISFYQWDFGDGATTTIDQSTVAHAYSAANNYFVQLTVFDNQSASSTATSTVAFVNPATVLSTNVNHVVISEIQAGTDANGAEDEFVELYNPTDQTISLNNWSLKKKTSSGSESNLVSASSFAGSIAPKSLFLITHINYRGPKTADLVYSANSNNLAYTNNSVVLYDIGGTVVDEVVYAEIPKDQSLERKALVDNVCVTPWDSSEHLGNGCDTDGSTGSPQADFELRATSNPQNIQSLPEPRSLPAAVQNFDVAYSPGALELNFDWTEDPALSYQISDVSSEVPIILAQNATSNFTKKITEIGREYKYEILAIDQDGLASSPAQFIINVPSFLESISWFNDPRDPSQYLMDLKWDDYPFVPIKLPHLVSGEEAENNWHVAVFYYNQEALVTDDIFWIDYTDSLPYKSWGLVAPSGFKIKYPDCFGSSQETAGAALILPDTIDQCSSLAGNHASYALDWNQLEDNHLLLNVDDFNFVNVAPTSGQDFITVAYYAYQPGYEPNNYGLGLAAIDKTKYYLLDSAPIHQPPTVPDNVDFDFSDDTSLLRIFWERSVDPDTLDNLISYEISYSDAGNSDTSNVLNTSDDYLEILVEPGATYNFELRAADDFGNFSETVTENYSAPDVPLPYNLTDIKWGRSADLSSVALNLEFEEYPFMDFGSPGAMIFFLNQMPPANYSFFDDDYRNGLQINGANGALELSYQPCDYNGTWNNKVNAAGMIFNNDECPDQSHLAMSKLLLAKLSGEDTDFIAEVINQREFNTSDYITIGFYQLGERDINGAAYFTNTVNYNKKIYFQQ